MMTSGNTKWFSEVATLGIYMCILSNLLNVVREWLRRNLNQGFVNLESMPLTLSTRHVI